VSEVAVTQRIAAPAESIYDLVSDITRMGEWSPENTGGTWLKGATGPTPGARFRGSNKRGWRRWSTTCTVTDADRGRSFGFDVALGPWAISHWGYRLEADGDGCQVTETWLDRRPSWLKRMSPTVMAVADWEAHNRAGMEATLAKLRAAAER
jgi:hypothetical protein